jgi:hypothetical protein
MTACCSGVRWLAAFAVCATSLRIVIRYGKTLALVGKRFTMIFRLVVIGSA